MGIDSRGELTGTNGPTGANPAEYAATVERVRLPPSVSRHVAAYEEAVGDRNPFLWKWVYNLFDEFTLPTVADSASRTVKGTKLLLTLYVTTVDDVAERRGDRRTLERARQIPFGPASGGDGAAGEDAELLAFLRRLWGTLEDRIEAAPRREEFGDLFRYDLRQVLNAVDYSMVVNDYREMANLAEVERYDAHNMVLYPYVCVDLMHSPSFGRADLRTLRSLLWELQAMARIGNWVSTWERELAEGDCSSGVVVRAIERGVVDPGEIGSDDVDPEALADRIRRNEIEADVLEEWDRSRRVAETYADRIDSFDATRLIDGMEVVLRHHLASDGLK
jgi:hypothetical protein